MSVMNIVLKIDGRPEVLAYLAEMGLKLPEGFRSRHPLHSEVRAAVAKLKGWSLGEPDRADTKNFWCDLYRDQLCVSSLMFHRTEDGNEAVFGGTRGDLVLQLLRTLAAVVGPQVVLLNAETPMLIEAQG